MRRFLMPAAILSALTNFLLPPVDSHVHAGKQRTENVLIVTLDGFRWQDFFGGAQQEYMDQKSGGVKDVDGLKKRYWRESETERREVMMPFVWQTIAKEGQIFGDQTQRSIVRITNGKKFSYPGYNEMFTGLADPRIDSNDKRSNPNLSVLEFLDNKEPYRGKVAAFCTWDVFPFIFRTDRNRLLVHTDWQPVVNQPTPRQKMMNEQLPNIPRYWPGNSFDFVIMEYAREHILQHRPRVFYLGLGETDEWGHGQRYDLYLDAANKADRFLQRLWNDMQAIEQYRNKTSLIITTDHGRGPTRADWINHNKDVPTAEIIWMVVYGPDTPPLGVRKGIEATQSQFAPSIAHLLGEDLRTATPGAALPLPDIVSTK